ncbi:CDP-alcohol phosphatidyltransferase family protein [Microbacterium gorillae]|uniref:CDP-alcohol phosphatidyltransferase family protein n=1 Tax=Microbacterium gorillae TaxID=1231063 RepID=UPI003D96D03B
MTSTRTHWRFRTALAELHSAQKSSSGAAAYSRFINRPLGRPLAAAAAAAGLTPTQVTLLSALCTFSAIGLIAAVEPNAVMSVVVAALLVLGYALDSADGQLARLTGTGSAAGEWLDHFFDALKAATIHLAILVSWTRSAELAPAMLVVPLVYSAVASTYFFGMIGADFLRRAAGAIPGVGSGAAYRSSPLYALAVLPTDYGLLCLAMLLLWLPVPFAVVYTFMAAATLAVLALAAVRWYRSLAALGSAV